MNSSIKIHEIVEKDLKGSVFIVGFPSVGLIGTITANFLINTLKLEQIGIVDSVKFPAITIIKNGEPHNPLRIYSGEQICNDGTCNQVTVCVSEFTPPAEMAKELVNELTDWAVEKGCAKIISAEGFSISSKDGGDDNDVYGIASTEGARPWIEEAKVKPFTFGTIGGITGAFLNEGKIRNLNVLGLLAEVSENVPDARAAANVIKAIDELLLAIELDPKPLLKEAETIEEEVQNVQKQAPPEVSASVSRYIG
ncbi:MAG: ATP-grasp superfamily enzyme [Euryarchaeota archaeon]|nr:ATP-grasp superfamily enzyme [Euryarchaeota archaeon]